MLNTTRVVKAKLSPTFNLTTFVEYLTGLYSRKGYQGQVGPDALEDTVNYSLLSNANRAKSSAVIQVANEAKTVFVQTD